jgi:homoserine O-acetyltransferase
MGKMSMPRATWLIAVALAAGGLITEAGAYDGIVEKRVFGLREYTTTGGETIKDAKVGWEVYGEPNEAMDNVIRLTHFFSGTSYAAGRYAADDAAPGYWDYLIGPGQPIDTDEYYVISSDTLVNLNVGLPNVVTTGPASLDPDTGRPYGMEFPIVTIRDFVNVQKVLLESLGITRLHAVMGACALQAYE